MKSVVSKEQIQKMRGKGMPDTEIAKKYGISRQRVGQLGGPNGRLWYKVEPDQVVEMVMKKGMPQAEVARKLGVHPMTISRICLGRVGREELEANRKAHTVTKMFEKAAALEKKGVMVNSHSYQHSGNRSFYEQIRYHFGGIKQFRKAYADSKRRNKK